MPAVAQSQVRDAVETDPGLLQRLMRMMGANVGSDADASWIDQAAGVQARQQLPANFTRPVRKGIVERNLPKSYDPSGQQQTQGQVAQLATDALGYGQAEQVADELQAGEYGSAISSGAAATAGNVIPFGRGVKPAIGVKGWMTTPLPIQRVGMDQTRFGKGVHVAENPRVGGPGGDFWNVYLHKGVDTEGNPIFNERQRAIAEQLRLHGFNRDDAINSLTHDIRQGQQIVDRAASVSKRPVVDINTIPHNLDVVKKTLEEDQLQRSLLQQKHNQFGPSSYQVGVRAQPGDFIDLNRYVLDHDDKVLEAILDITKKNPDIQRRVGGQLDKTGEDITGGQMFDAIGQSIGRVDDISTQAGKDKAGVAAMDYLQQHNIPGIRGIDKPTLSGFEMDKLTGKNKTIPTYNYNVADPNSVELMDMFRKQGDNVEELF